jgi:cell division protease FtsH
LESKARSRRRCGIPTRRRTRQRIDAEVKRIVGDAHDEAIRILTEQRERLDSLAEALLREETLDQPEAYAAAGLAAPEVQTPTAEPALAGSA